MRIFVVTALWCVMLSTVAATSALSCTTFCMDTPEGPVFGANLDLFIPGDGLVFVNRRGIAKEGYASSATGETETWVSKYGSVTFNVAGLEFAFGGMGVPPNHYLVADATGNCAAIEWLEGRFVTYTGAGLPVKALANMRCDRSIAAWERGEPRWWWSNPGQSAERVAAAHERSVQYDPGRDGDSVDYALETLTRVVAAPHTKWSIVYDIPAREIWFRSAESPAVKHVFFGAFDCSCEAPVLMLDVNADLDGDVSEAFGPYDHDVNLTLFRTLCSRFGIELSEKAAQEIVEPFEGFVCAE